MIENTFVGHLIQEQKKNKNLLKQKAKKKVINQIMNSITCKLDNFLKIFSLSQSLGRLSERLTRKNPTVKCYDGPFDMERYLGTWYQAFYIPNRFQDPNSSLTTAVYKTSECRSDIIDVTNIQVVDGKQDSISGFAWVTDPTKSKTKLRVSFFLPFSGQYWILQVREDNGSDQPYTYAMVGSSNNRFLWILTRNSDANVPEPILKEFLTQAESMGYDTSKGIKKI